MKFLNDKGEAINLADNLTLKELSEMGMQIQVVENNDPEHTQWTGQAEEFAEQPSSSN